MRLLIMPVLVGCATGWEDLPAAPPQTDPSHPCVVAEVSDLQLKQVMRTEGNQGCKADPLVVQQYLGFRSMKSPLFNAAKLMLRAEPLVADSKYDAYTAAVDEWTTKAQMSSTMAYTSSWGEANPNGGQENVEALLESTKIDVKQSRALLKRVIDILEVPPAPPFTPPSKS